jgi:hypothetical protein
VPAKITHPDPPAIDGTVKSPSAALRFIFRHCDVRKVRLIPQDSRALHLELFTVP